MFITRAGSRGLDGRVYGKLEVRRYCWEVEEGREKGEAAMSEIGGKVLLIRQR